MPMDAPRAAIFGEPLSSNSRFYEARMCTAELEFVKVLSARG